MERVGRRLASGYTGRVRADLRQPAAPGIGRHRDGERRAPLLRTRPHGRCEGTRRRLHG